MNTLTWFVIGLLAVGAVAALVAVIRMEREAKARQQRRSEEPKLGDSLDAQSAPMTPRASPDYGPAGSPQQQRAAARERARRDRENRARDSSDDSTVVDTGPDGRPRTSTKTSTPLTGLAILATADSTPQTDSGQTSAPACDPPPPPPPDPSPASPDLGPSSSPDPSPSVDTSSGGGDC